MVNRRIQPIAQKPLPCVLRICQPILTSLMPQVDQLSLSVAVMVQVEYGYWPQLTLRRQKSNYLSITVVQWSSMLHPWSQKTTVGQPFLPNKISSSTLHHHRKQPYIWHLMCGKMSITVRMVTMESWVELIWLPILRLMAIPLMKPFTLYALVKRIWMLKVWHCIAMP